MRPPSLLAALLAALLAILPAASPVLAQQPGARPGSSGRPPPKPQPAPQPEAPPPPPPEPPAPPYEKDLLRLSEVIGSLAFLRGLCAAADAREWPVRMQALLEAEGTTPGRKERIAGAYNRGYRGYALTYRTCTPAAREASNRFLKEGETLSRNLAGRFGG